MNTHPCACKVHSLFSVTDERTRLAGQSRSKDQVQWECGGVGWSAGVSEGVTHDFQTGLCNASVLAKPVPLLLPSLSYPPFSLILHRELDLNDISGTIEDTNGAFSGLDSLTKL